jgi:hypothetical protein
MMKCGKVEKEKGKPFFFFPPALFSRGEAGSCPSRRTDKK